MNQKDVKGKNQEAIRLSDVEILVLETENMRFKLSPRERVVNYGSSLESVGNNTK